MLAQLHWSLLSVQQSEDWQLRDHIDPTMLTAVADLQRRTLDAFAQIDGPGAECQNDRELCLGT